MRYWTRPTRSARPSTCSLARRTRSFRKSRSAQVDAKLRELGKNYKLKNYADADHGFFCDQRVSYEPKAAEDAWAELKSFFGEHLGR